MFRRWTASFLFAALPCIAAAQSFPGPAPPTYAPGAEAPSTGPAASSIDEAPAYMVEILIVEGEGASEELMPPPSDDAPAPWERISATFSDPETGEKALPPAAAPRNRGEAMRSAADVADPDPNSPPIDIAGEVSPAPRLPGTAVGSREPSLRESLAGYADVDILSAPKITVLEKQDATVYVATQQIFQYLVPIGEGKYELRRTDPQELGIRLSLAVKPTEDADAVVLSPLQIEVTSLDGREPVKGLDLDVGKPIVSSRSLKTTVPIRLGEERLLPIPSGPERNAALILRVERATFETLRQPTPAKER